MYQKTVDHFIQKLITLRTIIYRFIIVGIKPGIIYVLINLELDNRAKNIAIGFTCANTLASTLGFYFYKESFKKGTLKKNNLRVLIHKIYVNTVFYIIILLGLFISSVDIKNIMILIAVEFLIHEQGRCILYLENRLEFIKFYFIEYLKLICICLLMVLNLTNYAIILFMLNAIFLWDKRFINITKFLFLSTNLRKKWEYFILNIKSNVLFFLGGIISKLRLNIDKFVLLLIPEFGVSSYLTSIMGTSCAILIDTTILLEWRENLKNTKFEYNLNKLNKKLLLKSLMICISITSVYFSICIFEREFWQPYIFFPVVIGHCLNTFTMIYEETFLWKKSGKKFFIIQKYVLVISVASAALTILTKNPIFISFNLGFCFIVVYLILFKIKNENLAIKNG